MTQEQARYRLQVAVLALESITNRVDDFLAIAGGPHPVSVDYWAEVMGEIRDRAERAAAAATAPVPEPVRRNWMEQPD